MKNTYRSILAVVALAIFTTATVQAQFNYITHEGTITITRYTGAGGNVSIPSTIRWPACYQHRGPVVRGTAPA